MLKIIVLIDLARGFNKFCSSLLSTSNATLSSKGKIKFVKPVKVEEAKAEACLKWPGLLGQE